MGPPAKFIRELIIQKKGENYLRRFSENYQHIWMIYRFFGPFFKMRAKTFFLLTPSGFWTRVCPNLISNVYIKTVNNWTVNTLDIQEKTFWNRKKKQFGQEKTFWNSTTILVLIIPFQLTIFSTFHIEYTFPYTKIYF